ncbi:hypothetical protein FRC00_012306 [Tulasnella sp. 408]|nr:hypothetical protein FRC00_012306 [Tulasnella sp. 408]
MLGRKNSISTKGAYKASTTSAAMPPPPAPPVRPTTTPVMGDFSELESLIQQGEYEPLYVPPCHCFKCDRSGGAGVSLSESTRHESHVALHLHRPPCTASRTFPNVLADRSFSLPAAYVSPDMTMADSAVFVGFGGSASAAQSTSSNAAAGTPIGGSTLSPGGVGPVDPDFDNLLSAWMSPSTQNLPTPLSSFSTSPALYSSPFSDHLSTPAVDPLASFNSSGRSPDIVSASPAQPSFNLFDDLDSATSQSLFELMAHATAAQQLAANDKTPATTTAQTGSSTVKPTDLGLQLATGLSRHASWENASSASSSLSPQSLDSRNLPTSPGSSTGAVRRDSKAPQPNGVRKNVQVRDLIPLDAPIQSRNYITPSATSRKDIPPSVARTFVPTSRKRSSQMAGLPSTEDMQDELAAEDDPIVAEEMRRRREMDPEKAALLEHVEQARRRNTLAARKSRQRKLEHVRNLEEVVERLQSDNEELKKTMEQKDMEIDQLKEKLRIAEEKLQASLGGVPSSSS